MGYTNEDDIVFELNFDWELTQEIRNAMLMRRQQSEQAWRQFKGTAQATGYAERLIRIYAILDELGVPSEYRKIEHEVRESLEEK